NGNNAIAVEEATAALAAAPNADFTLSASDADSVQTLTFSIAVDPTPPQGCTAYDGGNPAHTNLLQITIPAISAIPGAPPGGSSSATGTLRIKAGPNAAGSWSFLVRVSDGLVTDQREVVLTVSRTNSAP